MPGGRHMIVIVLGDVKKVLTFNGQFTSRDGRAGGD